MMDRTRSGAVATAALLVGGLVAGIGGSASAASSTWTQDGDITVPGLSYASSGGPAAMVVSGAASIYPWTITVPDIGQVTDVNVTLTGLSHGYVGDLDVLLVGPGGQQVMLVSDPGDSFDVFASGIELTLDDEATDPLPNPTTDGAYPWGTYRPSNYSGTYGDDVFPSPAPPGTPGTALSVFDGTAAAGDWKLYVRDDDALDGGSLAGWSLTFITDAGTVTATPYPSEVTVSGLTAVRDVNLTLTGVDHPNAADLDVLLVGPDGDQAIVLSDTGGNQPVDLADLRLDDEATTPLPDTAPLTTGTWQPTNHGTDPDTFPAPAPALATGVGSALDVFDDTDPNGTWQLYVLGDNTELIDGMIDGWSLEITTDQDAPTGTVTINNAAATTATTAVTLALDATDPTPNASGLDSMRFSNNGTDWSPWQDYATTTPWTLTSGDGLKTVHAQFRDEAGNITTDQITDTITLTTPPAPAPAPAPARDTVSPTWVRFTPAKKAKAVSRSASIKVVISEDLDPATIARTTVYLKRRDTGRKINATISYDPATDTITINPNKLLRAETNYRVTIGIAVHDLAGNQFDGNTTVSGFQNHRWNFTTTD